MLQPAQNVKTQKYTQNLITLFFDISITLQADYYIDFL